MPHVSLKHITIYLLFCTIKQQKATIHKFKRETMMKNLNNLLTLSALIALLFVIANQNMFAQGKRTKLNYMLDESPEKIFELARIEKKPVLIFINSKTCFTSKKFTREVMSQAAIKGLVKGRYISMNADISTKFGKAMASKYNVMLLPAVILVSPEKEITYTCKLKMDTGIVMDQFKSFIAACNLLDQVRLLSSTSNLSEKDIISNIGKSYAKIDFRRNVGDIENALSFRTLDLKYFEAFKTAYREEYVAQQNGKNKKSQNSPMAMAK